MLFQYIQSSLKDDFYVFFQQFNKLYYVLIFFGFFVDLLDVIGYNKKYEIIGKNGFISIERGM